MMHHDPCEGLSLRACETCVRHVDRYRPEQLAGHRTRWRPMTVGHACADYVPLPERATDATHDKL